MPQSFFSFPTNVYFLRFSYSAVAVTRSRILITKLTRAVGDDVRPRCQDSMTPRPPSPNPCECITRSADGPIMRKCRTIFLLCFLWKVSLHYRGSPRFAELNAKCRNLLLYRTSRSVNQDSSGGFVRLFLADVEYIHRIIARFSPQYSN